MFYKEYESPLGKMGMESDGEVLLGLYFLDSPDEEKHTSMKEENDLPIFDETKRWLDRYFQGKDPGFTPSYRVDKATPFRLIVSKIMEKIPYGKTISYQEIAQEIATFKGIKKMSSQAVGGAVGWNPICLIIPCHRVVGKNGCLVGYGGGILRKKALLTLEGHKEDEFYLPKKEKK